MKLIYWISTGLLSAFLAWSCFSYFFSRPAIDGIRALGYPDHFRILLGALKGIAALAILIPATPLWLKDWSYAGAFFFFCMAITAHVSHGDSPAITGFLVLLIGLLGLSRWFLPL